MHQNLQKRTNPRARISSFARFAGMLLAMMLLMAVTMMLLMLTMMLMMLVTDAAAAESCLHQRDLSGIRDLFGSSIYLLINAIPQDPHSTKDDILLCL